MQISTGFWLAEPQSFTAETCVVLDTDFIGRTSSLVYSPWARPQNYRFEYQKAEHIDPLCIFGYTDVWSVQNTEPDIQNQ